MGPKASKHQRSEEMRVADNDMLGEKSEGNINGSHTFGQSTRTGGGRCRLPSLAMRPENGMLRAASMGRLFL